MKRSHLSLKEKGEQGSKFYLCSQRESSRFHFLKVHPVSLRKVYNRWGPVPAWCRPQLKNQFRKRLNRSRTYCLGKKDRNFFIYSVLKVVIAPLMALWTANFMFPKLPENSGSMNSRIETVILISLIASDISQAYRNPRHLEICPVSDCFRCNAHMYCFVSRKRTLTHVWSLQVYLARTQICEEKRLSTLRLNCLSCMFYRSLLNVYRSCLEWLYTRGEGNISSLFIKMTAPNGAY